MSEIRFAADALTAYACRVVAAMGAPEVVANEVARHLVGANLSGQDSHGVLRLPQYAGQVDRGELHPAAMPRIIRETVATAIVDAQRGFGHYAAHVALDVAAQKARHGGIGCAAIRHSTHVGRLGDFTERCDRLGLVVLATVGMAGPGVGGVVPHGGRERFFGANVWSIGVPGRSNPMVFDAAMSSIAVGKVYAAKAAGHELPAACIVDRDGRPTRDPNAFLQGGAALPFGGQVAAHKAFGLGLASALVGALAMIDDPSPTLAGAPAAPGSSPVGRMAGVFFVAIDPEAFGGLGLYRDLVDDCLRALHDVAPAPGVDAVTTPGQRSRETRANREHFGIPIPRSTCDDLSKLAMRFEVPMPAAPLGS
jgi:LDH2 family malate/lactate/ureidoglycolate dehydrogenase